MFNNRTILCISLFMAVFTSSYALQEPAIDPNMRLTGGSGFGSLFPAPKNTLGILQNDQYSAPLGNHTFKIDLPNFSRNDVLWLVIGEHQKIENSNVFSYVTFGPGATDRRQFMLGLAISNHPIAIETSYAIGQSIFNNYLTEVMGRFYQMPTQALMSQKGLFEGKPAFYAVAKAKRTQQMVGGLIAFYHVSFNEYYHATFIELIPDHECTSDHENAAMNENLTALKNWMSSLKFE